MGLLHYIILNNLRLHLNIHVYIVRQGINGKTRNQPKGFHFFYLKGLSSNNSCNLQPLFFKTFFKCYFIYIVNQKTYLVWKLE